MDSHLHHPSEKPSGLFQQADILLKQPRWNSRYAIIKPWPRQPAADGPSLLQHPRFADLTALAKVALCKVGFEANGLSEATEGLKDADLASQSWHAEMIYDCDRYLTF